MSTGPAPEDASLPRFGRVPALALGLALLILGLAYTAPLVRDAREALPYAAVPAAGRERVSGAPGDYLQLYYYLWLVRDRVLAGRSFLRDPYQFAVDGPRPNLPNIFLPAAAAFVPLSALGPRLAYNLLVLLSFPATGVAAALLAHRYGASRLGATVAAVVFACGPYRVGALLGGHPAGLAYPLVPLALWGLEGALAGRLGGGLACAAALAGLALMEPHFFYFAALGLPLHGLARLGLPAWTPRALAVGPGGWALAGAVALAPAAGALAALARRGWEAPGPVRLAVAGVIALLALGVWQLLAGGLLAAGVTREPRAAARQSALALLPWLLVAPGRGRALVATALALPLAIHAGRLLVHRRRWWRPDLPVGALAVAATGALAGGGLLLLLQRLLLRHSVSGGGRTLHEVLLFSPTPADLLARVNPAAGRAIYPGFVAVALAVVAAGALARRPPRGRGRVAAAFLPLLALGILLALGPRLTALPLFEVAFRLVPSWNFIRQPAKLQVLTALALAVLGAVGADALGRRRTGPARWAVALGLAAAVAVECHPWRPTGVSELPGGGEPFTTIRAGGGRALWVPFWPGDSAYSGLYLYATTLTRVPMLNGYSAWLDRSYLTDVYHPLEAVNLGVVGAAEAEQLRRRGVRQVILAPDAFPVKVSAFGPALALAHLRASPHLDEVATPAGAWTLHVFRVRDTPRPVPASTLTSPLGILWEAESLPRDTGRIADDPGASNGRVSLARAPGDRPGFLTFGPYRLLPPGAFRAEFRVKGEAATVELEVTTRGGRQRLGHVTARLDTGERFTSFTVPFALDAPAPVEYRVAWDGGGWAAVDWIAAAFAAEPDPAPAFEVEALGHELLDRADPEASGGVAGYASPTRTPRDAVWTGPLRGYPPGRYRLWIRVKLDAAAPGAFATCRVERASHGGTVAGRDLRGAELPEPGRYGELALPFTLPERAILEFPCVYRGGVGVWFDRLRIERLDGTG